MSLWLFEIPLTPRTTDFTCKKTSNISFIQTLLENIINLTCCNSQNVSFICWFVLSTIAFLLQTFSINAVFIAGPFYTSSCLFAGWNRHVRFASADRKFCIFCLGSIVSQNAKTILYNGSWMSFICNHTKLVGVYIIQFIKGKILISIDI